MLEIGFIGAGRMAGAMIRGLVKNYPADSIGCISQTGQSAHILSQETGIQNYSNIQELASSTKLLVLAVKPAVLEIVVQELAECPLPLTVSVLAGTSLETLRQALPTADGLVRLMPNTPTQVGKGMTALAQEKLSTSNQTLLENFLSPLGEYQELEEPLLDAVTGVSGCGPALLFEFIIYLSKAGEKAGLEPATALKFAQQTAIGSMALLENLNRPIEELRDEVAPPGGITEGLLKMMKESQLDKLLEKMVLRAKDF